MRDPENEETRHWKTQRPGVLGSNILHVIQASIPSGDLDRKISSTLYLYTQTISMHVTTEPEGNSGYVNDGKFMCECSLFSMYLSLPFSLGLSFLVSAPAIGNRLGIV